MSARGGAQSIAARLWRRLVARRVEFEPHTLPWLDRPRADVDAYVAGLPPDELPAYDLREALTGWRRLGYVMLPALIEPALIDAYLADLEELRRTRARRRTLVMVEGLGARPICELPEEALEHHHLRYLDFHNQSLAGKQILLHREVVRLLRHLFRAEVVAMQSLTFVHGSEQWTHQDYAYVVSDVPSQLAAAWVALEDVHPDAGPLAYYPGSHTIPKFDWGTESGLVHSSSSRFGELDFRDHIEAQCERAGLRRETVLPRKGDVFFWHGALAHAGSPVVDPVRTRRAFVAHYSTLPAYPRDRRRREAPPLRMRINGGWVYGDPTLPEEEDSFTRGAAL